MGDPTFGKLLASLRNSGSMEERKGVLQAASSQITVTCEQLGQILASLHFPAERKTAADILAQCVTDKQNFRTHLMPYLALESSDIRAHVAKAVARS